MGRPARFDADVLLDAAARLAVERGPAAVTLARVAGEAGAPSGSVYHRFASVAQLLAALWLRSLARFQDELVEALDGDDDDPRAALEAAALLTIRWSREHPLDARLLLYGPGDFRPREWPTEQQAALAQIDERGARALRAAVRRLGLQDPQAQERAVFGVVDVPLAAVRRFLADGEPVPADAEALVLPAVRALLSPAPASSPCR